MASQSQGTEPSHRLTSYVLSLFFSMFIDTGLGMQYFIALGFRMLFNATTSKNTGLRKISMVGSSLAHNFKH